MRHSYATAALKAGVSPKVISERLGHSAVAFTLQTYTHVIPGMDQDAANAVAQLIMGADSNAGGSISGSIASLTGVQQGEGPPDSAHLRRSADPSSGSGGRI